MRVWIDQDLCTGDGLCAEIAPDVFFMHSDGLAYVRQIGEVAWLGTDGEPKYKMGDGTVDFPDARLDDVVTSAEDCPGECIFIEPGED